MACLAMLLDVFEAKKCFALVTLKWLIDTFREVTILHSVDAIPLLEELLKWQPNFALDLSVWHPNQIVIELVVLFVRASYLNMLLVLVQFAANIFVRTTLNLTLLQAHTRKHKVWGWLRPSPCLKAGCAADFVAALANKVVGSDQHTVTGNALQSLQCA